MGIKKVLFAVSYWEMGYKGLLEIITLRKVGLEEIYLLHVIPREEVSYVPFSGFLKEKAVELKEAAKLKFEDWEKEIKKANLKSHILIEIGDPIAKILEIAEEIEVDMLVIGKLKKEGIFVSERTLELTSRSKVPVLVYCHSLLREQEEKPIPLENVQIFRTPILATDFSENSIRARDFLLNFKSLIQKIYVVNIIKSEKISTLKEEEIQRLEEERRNRLIKFLEPYKLQGIEGDIFLGLGENPSQEILEFVREKEGTLIVLGKTSKGFLEKLFIGSVTLELLKKAEFPLLIVP
ncbi:MAG: universal stress protein [Caldimicrobium sp.]|jgi:nucleotide-binding universal stress UspA family protein